MNKSKRPQEDLRPALIFLTGDLLAVPIPLEREEVILGRALEADVRVNDTKISRKHARINAILDEEAFQVPDGGQPIVLMPDGPTVGGYPKLAVVARVDLPLLAQSPPGRVIRFREISPDEARDALRRQARELRELARSGE
jgi:allophanate hydrolase subunit 2